MSLSDNLYMSGMPARIKRKAKAFDDNFPFQISVLKILIAGLASAAFWIVRTIFRTRVCPGILTEAVRHPRTRAMPASPATISAEPRARAGLMRSRRSSKPARVLNRMPTLRAAVTWMTFPCRRASTMRK